MNNPSDIRILFATSFSDSCFRTSRALAQLADRLRMDLTLVHITPPGAIDLQKRRELNSFLAEVDHFDFCRRMMVESNDAPGAICELAQPVLYDLVVAPSSDRLGLQQLFTTSFRARVLESCKVPLWTAGRWLDKGPSKASLQTIACVVDFDQFESHHVRVAASLAWRIGADLRVVAVVPPVHEGMLAQAMLSDAPLTPKMGVHRLESKLSSVRGLKFDVALGAPGEGVVRLLRRCEADLAFFGKGQVLRRGMRSSLVGYLDELPCPAICLDGAAADFSTWTFEREHVPAYLPHSADVTHYRHAS